MEKAQRLGKLYGSKCYVVGPMEFADGRAWREKLAKDLSKLGIVTLDPYNKPFRETFYKEDEKNQEKLIFLRKNGKFDRLCRMMKLIRYSDLRLCDLCDFAVVYILPNVPTFGSMEELSVLLRMKRPVFIVVEGGKKTCPLWLFGMLNHKYMFDSFNKVLAYIRRLNSGTISLNLKTWRLLNIN